MAVVTGLLDTLGIKGKGRKALENMMDSLASSLHRTVSLTVETTGAGAAPANFSSAGVANPFGLTVPATSNPATAFPAGFSNPFGFTVPAMASVGIVNVPTMALIGESGPEAVIPLSSGSGSSVLGALAGGNNYTINVNTGVGDPRAIGQEVVGYIKRFEQANGPVFVSA
jgi:hypothetical protein